MPKGEYLGEFEQLVLFTLLRLKDNAYGVTVRREIEARTGRSVAIGAVYATLERLERKGYASSHVTTPDPVPGGRSKKCFQLTREGGRALAQAREMIERISEGLAIDAELKSL